MSFITFVKNMLDIGVVITYYTD